MIHETCIAILLGEFGMGFTRWRSIIGFLIFGTIAIAIALWLKLKGKKDEVK